MSTPCKRLRLVSRRLGARGSAVAFQDRPRVAAPAPLPLEGLRARARRRRRGDPARSRRPPLRPALGREPCPRPPCRRRARPRRSPSPRSERARAADSVSAAPPPPDGGGRGRLRRAEPSDSARSLCRRGWPRSDGRAVGPTPRRRGPGAPCAAAPKRVASVVPIRNVTVSPGTNRFDGNGHHIRSFDHASCPAGRRPRTACSGPASRIRYSIPCSTKPSPLPHGTPTVGKGIPNGST